MKPKRPDFADAVRESFAQQGAMRHIGARIVRIEPGLCEIALDYRPELAQQNGFFHAGITSAIADSAGGYARGETLIACGNVVRAGRLSATRLRLENRPTLTRAAQAALRTSSAPASHYPTRRIRKPA